MSSYTLSPLEKDSSTLGLRFCFNKLKMNNIKHFVAFDDLFKSISSNQILSSNVDSLNRVRSTIKKRAFDRTSPLDWR